MQMKNTGQSKLGSLSSKTTLTSQRSSSESCAANPSLGQPEVVLNHDYEHTLKKKMGSK